MHAIFNGTKVPLTSLGKEDGQDQYIGLAPGGALLEYDVWNHANGTLQSLTVDLSRNDPALRNITNYSGEVEGLQFAAPLARIMTRTRFVRGPRPPIRPQTFYEFSPSPNPPVWEPADYTITPGTLGRCCKVPADQPGGGPDRSCHLPNWYDDAMMLRAYGDCDGCWPVAVREAEDPYAPIARDGFQMGFNAFSHAAWKAGERAIGAKYQIPHATSNSVLPWMIWGDLFYKRSLINIGNYAAMYGQTEMPTPPKVYKSVPRYVAATEYRGIFRMLNQMLVATEIDGDKWRWGKIQEILEYLDSWASDPFGKPGETGGPIRAISRDAATGRYFLNYWQVSFAFYTLDLAGRLGCYSGQKYLAALMDFQESLGPDNIGCYLPYRLFIKNPALPITASNVEPKDKTDREDDLRVVAEVMRRHGRKPQRPLAELMTSAYYTSKEREYAAFRIHDSTRPAKPPELTLESLDERVRVLEARM